MLTSEQKWPFGKLTVPRRVAFAVSASLLQTEALAFQSANVADFPGMALV
jgi:hypothetical protein